MNRPSWWARNKGRSFSTFPRTNFPWQQQDRGNVRSPPKSFSHCPWPRGATFGSLIQEFRVECQISVHREQIRSSSRSTKEFPDHTKKKTYKDSSRCRSWAGWMLSNLPIRSWFRGGGLGSARESLLFSGNEPTAGSAEQTHRNGTTALDIRSGVGHFFFEERLDRTKFHN